MTKIERQILINQYEILLKLEGEKSHHISSSRKALEQLRSGYLFRFEEDLDDHMCEELDRDLAKLVEDILNVYFNMQNLYRNLTDLEKKNLSNYKDFSLYDVKFTGFDFNDEIECKAGAYAEYLMKIEGRFKIDLHEKSLNSHGFGKNLKQYKELVKRFNVFKNKKSNIFEDVDSIDIYTVITGSPVSEAISALKE